MRSRRIHDDMCDVYCLTCAAYFEFNITGEEFRDSYIEHGGSEHMADHMWGKFDQYNHSILKTLGNADLNNRRLLTMVVNDWCEEHPQVVR